MAKMNINVKVILCIYNPNGIRMANSRIWNMSHMQQ